MYHYNCHNKQLAVKWSTLPGSFSYISRRTTAIAAKDFFGSLVSVSLVLLQISLLGVSSSWEEGITTNYKI